MTEREPNENKTHVSHHTRETRFFVFILYPTCNTHTYLPLPSPVRSRASGPSVSRPRSCERDSCASHCYNYKYALRDPSATRPIHATPPATLTRHVDMSLTHIHVSLPDLPPLLISPDCLPQFPPVTLSARLSLPSATSRRRLSRRRLALRRLDELRRLRRGGLVNDVGHCWSSK